jgi:hypothetical protein
VKVLVVSRGLEKLKFVPSAVRDAQEGCKHLSRIFEGEAYPAWPTVLLDILEKAVHGNNGSINSKTNFLFSPEIFSGFRILSDSSVLGGMHEN